MPEPPRAYSVAVAGGPNARAGGWQSSQFAEQIVSAVTYTIEYNQPHCLAYILGLGLHGILELEMVRKALVDADNIVRGN